MKRIKAVGKVVECHPSKVMKGRYYVTAELEYWGQVKYASTKKREVGEEVVLTDQRCRCQADMIRWQEVKK